MESKITNTAHTSHGDIDLLCGGYRLPTEDILDVRDDSCHVKQLMSAWEKGQPLLRCLQHCLHARDHATHVWRDQVILLEKVSLTHNNPY